MIKDTNSKDRFRCFISGWINEFRTQIAHFSCILSLVFFSIYLSVRSGIIWSVAFAVYYCTLAILGNCISTLRTERNDNKEEIKSHFKILFVIVALCCFILCGIITNIFQAIVNVMLLTIITGLFYLFDLDNGHKAFEILFEDDLPQIQKFKFVDYFKKHFILYNVLYYGTILAMVVLSIFYLPCKLWIKIVVFLVYILAIPVISKLAGDGANINEIINP